MRNQTASSRASRPVTAAAPVRSPRSRSRAARVQAEALGTLGTPFAIPTKDKAPDHARVPSHGALPSYCDRQPAAVLDDGWVGETLEASDDFDAMDAYDDFLDDSGDIEDSR